MKKRNLMLGSAIMLAVLLVAGGTLAWFTDTVDPVINSFTAGTVDIELHDVVYNEQEELVPFEAITNVNPGDTEEKIVYVENVGSKRAFVRVKLTPEFVGMEEADYELVDYPILNGWILHTDGWYYYPYEVAAGASTPNIIEEVIFAGANMGNEYQGVEFTLTVEAEAIQVTNGAALSEWGVDPLTLVTP
jgi:predicted ribosomally synthesized peptide with SipW-like signal peptide